MLLEPGQIEKTLAAQIAVIGSGPAGLALAMSLAKVGHNVLVLESGLKSPSDFATSLATAAEIPDNHAKPESLGNRRLGGASWTWGGRSVPFHPTDFETRPGAEAPGWPVSFEEMMSTSVEAADFFGIGSSDFTPPPHPEFADTDLPVILERWCSTPLLVKRHRKTLQGNHSIKVCLGVTCTGLTINEQGHVEQISCKDSNGDRISVQSDYVVLAAGGIETARLLLWTFAPLPAHVKPEWLGRGYMGHLAGSISDIILAPKSANALDYFKAKEGCFARRRLLLDPKITRDHGLLNISFQLDNPPMRNPDHRSAGLSATTLALSTPGISQFLLSDTMREVLIGPTLTKSETLKHCTNVLSAPHKAISFGIAALYGRFSKPVRPGIIDRNPSGRYALKFSAEETAYYTNAVTLSDTKDALGLPRARIARNLSQHDTDSAIKAHELFDQTIRKLGIGHLIVNDPPSALGESICSQSGDGYHQIGTARMGDTPNTSVTDVNACVHGTDNLFIAGSATFPTSSHAHPTFMIVCQALRLANHLKAQLATKYHARAHPTATDEVSNQNHRAKTTQLSCP